MKVALVEVRLYESSPCCGNIYVSGLTTPPLTSPHLSSPLLTAEHDGRRVLRGVRV